MADPVNEVNAYRQKMNEVILRQNNRVLKRLWNLGTNTYEEGALDKKTKEMLGLVVRQLAIGVKLRKRVNGCNTGWQWI